MKQKLLKTIVLGLMAMVGVNTWADTFSPTADVYFRTSLSETYSWSSGYPKTAATLGDNNMAGNHRVGMFVLQKYSVENLKAANKITLKVKRVTSGGGDALGIWAFSTNDWSNESTAATLASAVNTIVGLDLNTTGTPSNSPLVNGASTITDDVCSFAISGTALTTLKEAATYDGTTGTFTLLITNKTNDMSSNSSSDRKFYGSGHSTEANRPYIDVDFYPVAIGNTAYATLNAAVSAATTDDVITIYDDIELSSQISIGTALSIVPAKAGLTIKRATSLGNNVLFTTSAAVAVSLGSASYSLTIDGQSTSSTRQLVEITQGSLSLTNTSIKDVYTSSNQGVVCAKSNGIVKLTDVTFDGCQATAENAGIVFCGINDGIVLSDNNTFTGCTGYGMYLERRFKIDETNGISHTTPISIFVKTDNIALGGVVATKANDDDVMRFVIKNAGYGLYKNTGSGRQDLKCCEGYPLEVTSAGAATLMLPYASTIPTGVTCYTLSYTSGDDITATEVTGGTLSANTPVLVIANEGLYYMLNSTKATSATSYTASDIHTEGVLTGVYKKTTVTAGNYILTKHDDVVAFRKVKEGSTNKVQAYRAYLTASHSASAPEFLGINFDGNVTAIDTIEKKTLTDDGEIYNLQGVRMTGSNLPKGIYVKNGKKFVVK